MDTDSQFHDALRDIQRFVMKHASQQTPSGGRVSKGDLCKAYNLDPRTFSNRLVRRHGAHTRLIASYLELANDIRRDEQAMVRRFLPRAANPETGRSPMPVELLNTAATLAASIDLEASVGTARHGLRLAIETAPELVPVVLPQTLYIFLRHASPRHLVQAIRGEVASAITMRAKFKIPPHEAAAAIAQLSCILNEGGAYSRSLELFRSNGVRKLVNDGGALDWCGPMVIRNQAHAMAWCSGEFSAAVDLARDALDRSPTDTNRHSVANTLCEIHLHSGRFREAWGAIEGYYRQIRAQLARQYDSRTHDFAGPSIPRFQSSFGSLYTAIVVRLSLNDPGYSASDQEEDMRLLEAMLQVGSDGECGRRMLHGGIVAIPQQALRRPIAERLNRIAAMTLKPKLKESAIADVMKCVTALRVSAGL